MALLPETVRLQCVLGRSPHVDPQRGPPVGSLMGQVDVLPRVVPRSRVSDSASARERDGSSGDLLLICSAGQHQAPPCEEPRCAASREFYVPSCLWRCVALRPRVFAASRPERACIHFCMKGFLFLQRAGQSELVSMFT